MGLTLSTPGLGFKILSKDKYLLNYFVSPPGTLDSGYGGIALSTCGWSASLSCLLGRVYKMFLLGPRTGHLRLVMGLDMDIDTGSLDKGLVTISAGVRLLPGVKPLMVLPSPL